MGDGHLTTAPVLLSSALAGDAFMKLRVFPLGGLGEVGMNCLALEQDGHVMLIDCGVTFDDRGLGIDVIHPDFSALDAYRDRIAGVFITHGHEDHIGALPYLLARHDVPIWAPKYSLGLIRERLDEHEILRHARLVEVAPRETHVVGPFSVEPIRVTHSIADATALAIRTAAGLVIHTGDFKIDETPPDGEHFDSDRFQELGDEGVDLLFSDSTNIDAAGPTGSEAGVGDVIEKIVVEATGAVVVALFASNVHRLRLLGEIALKTKRKLVILGRSVKRHAAVARGTGYLDWPSDLVWPAERAKELPRERILGLATGTQAETRGALARLARGDHQSLDLVKDDTVILSARTIPGHEPEVYALMGSLLRREVKLRTWVTDRGIHVSGHAHRVEQRRMLELVRPKAFVPVHGTLHHLTRHAALAREVGVPSVAVLENGDVATLQAGVIQKTDRVTSGRGFAAFGKPLSRAVIKERMALAQDGTCAVTVLYVAEDEINVHVASKGVVVEGSHLHADAIREARAAWLATSVDAKQPLAARCGVRAESARRAVRRVFEHATGFKPMTMVTVMFVPPAR
ncbi:ribonuclease J [soil metagenome]